MTKTRIYMLSHPDSTDFYIGSTKNTYTRRKQTGYSGKVKDWAIEMGGGCIYTTLEEIDPDHTDDETYRFQREQYWIERLKPTLNSQRAFLTEEDRKKEKAESQKRNREAANARNRKYEASGTEEEKLARSERKKELARARYAAMSEEERKEACKKKNDATKLRKQMAKLAISYQGVSVSQTS